MAKVDQTLSCEVCGRKYRSEWQLKEHHGRKHSGLKPHACSLCPKRFPYESFLKAHEVTHTKERNCVCDTCGKAYPTTSGLRRHIGALHPDVEMPQKYIYASLAENIPVLNQSIFEDHESSEEEVAVASIGCENPSQQTYSSDPLALPPTIQTDQPLLLKYRDNMNLIQQTEVKPFTETGNESEPILNVNLHDGPSFSTNESDDDEKFSPGDYESFEERTLYSSASFKTVVSEPQRLVQRLRRVKRSKSRSKELFPDPSLLVPKIKIESEDEEKKVVKYKSKRKVETTVKCRLDGCKFRAADHEELASHRADSHGRTEEVRRYKYKCSVRTCKFKARFPDSLESHRMTVHSESVTTPGQKTYPYTCILSGCGKGFNHRIRLTAHVHQCHKRGSYIVPYNCPKYRYSCTIPDCPNKFNHRQRLTEHLERSHGEKAQTPLPVPAHTQDYIYNCPIPNCTKGFTHRVRLDAHLQNLHGELSQISSQPQSKRYMCTFSNCSQRFDHHYRLEAHLQNFHAENFENVVGDEYKSEIRCRLNGCSFRTKFRSQLKNHRNSVHGISFTRSFTHPCSVEGCKFKGISPWSLAKHEREHREGSSGEKVKESTRKFSCDVPGCGFRSSLLENLQNHNLRVHENKPPTVKYKCTDCEKTFRSHSYMQLHKKMKHSDAAGDIRRQFHVICQICGRELSNKVWLHRHMRRVHPDAPSFSCTFCSKIYYDEEVWKQHVPRHDRYGGSLTPFRCVVTACNQIPLSLMELKTHVGQDHDSGQEPRVMCATCGVTTRQSNLRAHELTHIAYTPFHCPLCPKAFRRDLALEQHRESKHPETLEGEGKYTCSFCEKKFHAKGNLFRHTFLHRSGGKRKPWVRKRKESVKSRQPRKKRAKSEQPIGGADCGKPSQQICYSETAYLNFQRFLSEEVGPYYHHQTLNYM